MDKLDTTIYVTSVTSAFLAFLVSYGLSRIVSLESIWKNLWGGFFIGFFVVVVVGVLVAVISLKSQEKGGGKNDY